MSVYFISGKPGGGKSLFAVKKVVDELILTQRVIITNLSLKLPELNAYLQEHHPEKEIDLHTRIILMSEEETARFWLQRPLGYRLKQEGDKVTDWKHAYDESGMAFPLHNLPSVLYIIDELHIYFNARAWMATGKDALFYLSQHRKFGDDIFCITQSINNVDKQFRSVAQEFIYIRNHAKERIGIFRSIPGFTRSHYLQPVTGAPGEKAMETGYFRLDVSGLCQCYDTAAGVGVIGRSADTKQPKKGLPISALIGLIVLIAVGMMFVPKLIAKAVSGSTKLASTAVNGGKANSGGVEASPARPTAAMEGQGAVKSLPTPTNLPTATASSTNAHREAPYLTGVSLLGRHGVAYFSDGTEITTDDPRLYKIGTDYVILGQTIYRVRHPLSATQTRQR